MRTDSKKVFTAVLASLMALASATYAHASNFTVGGTISGLSSGASVTLLDNGGDAYKATANGKFTFSTGFASGATYDVTVGTQPAGETCTVTLGSGTVGTKNVTTVKVTCKAYTIGGIVSGLLTGASVTLLDNGGDAYKATANGKFTFSTGFASGATYDVTVGTQPSGETCTVTLGSGTVGKKNVTTVKVTCKAYTIGGTVSGLLTGASVTLLDHGGDAYKATANGKFTFSTGLASGATYDVTVGTQPAGETCTVTGGSGTVGTKDVITVKVTCKASTTTFSIGGTVSGLNSSTSVTLLDNGGNSLPVTANGAFTFTTKLASGATYKVTVGTQPTGETCTVTNGSGTVGSANVTNIAVACSSGGGGGGGLPAPGAWPRLLHPLSPHPPPLGTPARKYRPVPHPLGQAVLVPRSNFYHHRHDPASRHWNANLREQRSRHVLASGNDVCGHQLRRNHQDLRPNTRRHVERPDADPDQQPGVAFGPADLRQLRLGDRRHQSGFGVRGHPGWDCGAVHLHRGHLRGRPLHRFSNDGPRGRESEHN